MQQNSFFYSNRDTTDAKNVWSLCPVQDIDTVLTNRYGVNVNVNVDDTFSLLYCDLYFRELKETFKHTMLVHESVFESQIHELHRLYRKQKELMMEMEGTRHHETLSLNSCFPNSRTHWMSSSDSAHQTRNYPHEEGISNHIEAGLLVDNKAEKSEKKVLDLELPVFEYNNDMNGMVHETPNFLRSMSLESGKELNKMQLDLNEPAKVEEHSDYVFNQFLSSVTSNEIGEESGTKNEGEDSAKGSHEMNEVSAKCLGDYGIDLNMSPLSSDEEVTIVKKFETEKPQESLSVSLRPVIVQALPCSTSLLLLDKRYKPRKKVKLGPRNKTIKDSDLDQHFNAQATSESQSNQANKEKESSCSLSKVKSARNQTSLGKKKRCKPQMKSSKCHKVDVNKTGRVKRKKSRRICLVTEGNYQEISAAEAIVDMSRKTRRETADCITPLDRNLLWFAEISSSVAEDHKRDNSEAMTLQMTEMKLVENKTNLRLNSSDNKTAVSSIVLGRQRRSKARHGKQKCNNQTFTECEATEDLQVIGKLIEDSELKWNRRSRKNKSESSPPKPINVEWGATKKRRLGSRIPATDFQYMSINQLV